MYSLSGLHRQADGLLRLLIEAFIYLNVAFEFIKSLLIVTLLITLQYYYQARIMKLIPLSLFQKA